MRIQLVARIMSCALTALFLAATSACQSQAPEVGLNPGPAPQPGQEKAEASTGPPADAIPPGELSAVLSEHFKGLGYMEQYEYRKAVDAFREVRRRAPGWTPGAINLAIALLNDTGVQEDERGKTARDGAASNFDEALALLGAVLERDPGHPHAHYCRGIILEQQGNLTEAHRHFQRVTEIDPHDAASFYWLAATLTDPDNATAPDVRALSRKQIPILERALECDPYLAPALFRLTQAYRLSNNPQKARALFARWQELKQDREKGSPGTGNTVEKKYGDMGKYATVMNPFPHEEPAAGAAAPAPRFEPARAIDVKLGAGERWVKPADFTGALQVIGRIRARFGAGIAAFDADGDGQLDLYLASAVAGPKGIRDALLLNKGNGRFEDASAAFGLPADRFSVGVAAADFDADRHIDVFLTGIGANRLLRNRDGKRFEDISAALPQSGPRALSLMARWLDLDQDGDLDLYVVNHCPAEDADRAFQAAPRSPVRGVANVAFRNDGQPEPIPRAPEQVWAPLAVAWKDVGAKRGLSIALSPWTEAEALAGRVSAHTGICALDIDNDRDLDLVLTCDDGPVLAVLNDRLGQFHDVVLEELTTRERLSGLLTSDVDSDGRADLIAASREGPARAWRNTTQRTTAAQTKLTFTPWPLDASRWRVAHAIDLDLDGWLDLLGLPSGSDDLADSFLAPPAWARNEGKRFAAQPLALGPASDGAQGIVAVDLTGDPLPDLLLVRSGEPPTLARNLGNGQHWVALELGGHWRVKPELMRTNSHAIGTRVVLEGPGTRVNYDHTTLESGLGQSIAPVVLGLGRQERADLLHLAWPDGVMQCELNIAADQRLKLSENNRKTGSCPVLFTWNGRRFVCIGDFLGGGGLGYLVAPGIYSQPDRDESMAITPEQLQATGGVFRIAVSEPMDEVAYLDQLQLEAIDRPPGVSVTVLERFAPTGERPSGAPLAWRTAIEPAGATDLAGRDVSEALRYWDGRAVDGFRVRAGWAGYAEEHGIVLDFGTRLSRYGSADRLVLCLAGWVEYPYSQTNYAAATAGVRLEPPVIERRRDDGSWEVIEPSAGYPAGMPRLTTVELTGKLSGPRCVIRIRTNMECYYDQAFLAVRDREAERSLRITTMQMKRAGLSYRGYMREITLEGGLAPSYDFDHVEAVPLARFAGRLTRYGDVARLLQRDDDRFCVVGPGDLVQLEFDASILPELQPGWKRSYVLKATGYCKDADPC
jgi:tetratricopeptide (TPR) repeat protein